MKNLLRMGLLAAIFLGIVGTSLQAVEQAAINKAIDKGVEALRAMQATDGTWRNSEIGATALAGLTLLECGAKPDDWAVEHAADAIRKASLTLNHNYSISLAILFFDKLGDPQDIPLIESLTVRLLAGQTLSGGWNYHSPQVSDAEARRLQAILAKRKADIGRRDRPKPAHGKRTVKDLPREIQQQLSLIQRVGDMNTELPSDNSNTQFATLALWVARRYGMPVDSALKRVESRFRTSQQADGGWGYFDRGLIVGPMAASTASMTCAGLLGLAVADGKATESARERRPGAAPPRDINKDTHIRKGLFALSSVIGSPRDATGRRGVAVAPGPPGPPEVGGRTYYFLWSLERVAVALDLKTIGKKDWYAWGAEVLLANQEKDGTWIGTYAPCGADTCFALLFLKRANLVPDLTMHLTGRVEDPGSRVLKASPLGSEGIAIDKGLASGLESKAASNHTDGKYPTEITKKMESQPITKPLSDPTGREKRSETKARHDDPVPEEKPLTPLRPTNPSTMNLAGTPTARMADDLVRSTGTRYDLFLQNMREGKGAEFTEALALAIPKLTGPREQKAREVLVERLKRMKDSTLTEYLTDSLPEIRRAAALASAAKGSKSLIPHVISLLNDARSEVSEAAHQALKELTGEDFGPPTSATREERAEAERKWLDWWLKQKK